MEWTRWIDATLLLHALALFYLCFIILRAAYVKHNSRMWRVYPPVLLVTWALSEFMDATVYARRWLSQMSGMKEISYNSGISMALNIGSFIAIIILIARIHYGESSDLSAKRDQEKGGTQE